MYEVISKDSGQRLALCEQPRYVRIIPNTGVYVQCSADQAEGIAVNGTVFALSDQVKVCKVDTGAIIADAAQQASEILKIKAALCELDLAGGE
ncbi:MAG: hypothetical protein IJ520_09960 [Synergistaceae bacterium]|nr:hypothetical protein [Synergistaceae bacterium]MBR1602149.1 hypothetical protein [Synergistaceae bacterium]